MIAWSEGETRSTWGLTPRGRTDKLEFTLRVSEQFYPSKAASGCLPGDLGWKCLEIARRYVRGARRQGPDRCRGSLRPPRQPVEPEDEAVHLRQAQPDSYHRLERDRPRPAPRDQVLPADRVLERPDPVRRHQAAGGRDDHRAVQPRRDALRDRAVAGWDADQLPDDSQPAPAARGAGDDPGWRAGAELLQEDDLDPDPRAAEDRAQPERHPT